MRTVVRVHALRTDKTIEIVMGEHCHYISNLAMDRADAGRWKVLVRRRWDRTL
jgi:hypothetical protein